MASRETIITGAGITYEKALSDGYYDDLKRKINAYLTRELSPNYTYLGETSVAVQFKYRLPEKGYLDVDLLLSPYWESREHYWRDLAKIHPPLRRLTSVIATHYPKPYISAHFSFRFSASTSKYQTAFIKRQPQRVSTSTIGIVT